MLNNILDLEGVTTLKKNEQKSIKAGVYYGDQCLRLCGGHCSFGHCYEMIK
ncbi:hypothetical protein [Aquimarina sediminis]|uniref:hypothetical protein n=1 Tax=Aquimarina sediminis TaxID=2070536 RepID=UPI0013E8C312|nr:hypothetical protein [Aquimarina sediminis]